MTAVDLLRTKICIPVLDRRDNNDRLKYLPEVEKELNASREEMLRRQFLRVKDIIDYAYENTPFYRRLYDDAGVHVRRIDNPRDLLKIPCITKKELREHKAELLSQEFAEKQLIETATGGTTEAPVRLYLDRESYGRRQAASLFFYKWFDYRLGDKIAYLWGSGRDCGKPLPLISRIKNNLSYRFLMIHASDLSDETLRTHYQSIKNFGPKVLQSYPNSLYVFSCFLEKHDLKLRVPVIEVTAERLYQYQRKKIESVFGTKVFNWYGARELGHGATECARHNGMHINSYGLYFEVLKQGRHVFDEYGELAVTDLFNKAMPIIRYRIGDIGKISMRRCGCCSPCPILEDVVGRHADIFRKSDGSLVPGINYDDPTCDELRGIDRYQVVQKDYGLFELNIVKNKNHKQKELELIQARISRLMNEKVLFSVNFMKDIPREMSGKVRFMKCELQDSPTDIDSGELLQEKRVV